MDKRCLPRTDKNKRLLSEINIAVWNKKRAAFFATNPKCAECGSVFDHFSRTMVCRECQRWISPAQSKKYRQKYKEKIQAYMKKYYIEHKEEISMRQKYRYQERKAKNEA